MLHSRGEVSLLKRELDLGRYVTSILQIGEKLTDATVTSNGYLITENILECLQISNLDSIIRKLTETHALETFTGGIMSKGGIGKN